MIVTTKEDHMIVTTTDDHHDFDYKGCCGWCIVRNVGKAGWGLCGSWVARQAVVGDGIVKDYQLVLLQVLVFSFGLQPDEH